MRVLVCGLGVCSFDLFGLWDPGSASALHMLLRSPIVRVSKVAASDREEAPEPTSEELETAVDGCDDVDSSDE